jgi:redox-sensitive bicupin YhaK (pirin superfamily)
VLFKNDGDEVVVEAESDAIGMFLSGAPIDEPLVHYGPFVMTSVDEINEAIEDFNSGRFGRLDD